MSSIQLIVIVLSGVLVISVKSKSFATSQRSSKNFKIGKGKVYLQGKHAESTRAIRVKRSEEDDTKCQKEANEKFMKFIGTFGAINSEHQELIKNIGNLKCAFVSIAIFFIQCWVFRNL